MPLASGLLRSWQCFSVSMGPRQTQHTPTVGGQRLSISFFLNVGGANLYVASKEALDPVCFGTGVSGVVVPTHCVVYCDAKVPG